MTDFSAHSDCQPWEKKLMEPPLLRFLNLLRLPVPYPLYVFTSIITAILLNDLIMSDVGNVKKIGALFQCIATGYITWAVIYSYSALKNEIKTFASLIQTDNKASIDNSISWVTNESVEKVSF